VLPPRRYFDSFGGLNIKITIVTSKLLILSKAIVWLKNLKGGWKMPYLVVQSCYPLTSGAQVGKKYLEVNEKYPPDESLAKPVVPAAVTTSQKGRQVISINEVEKEKVGDAIEDAERRMFEFRNIEGFTFEIKIWLKVEEALKLAGLE
jgi:hypothetical protein